MYMKCKKCGIKIQPLELFPGEICIDCHEKQFNKRLKEIGILPKPDFLKVFK